MYFVANTFAHACWFGALILQFNISQAQRQRQKFLSPQEPPPPKKKGEKYDSNEYSQRFFLSFFLVGGGGGGVLVVMELFVFGDAPGKYLTAKLGGELTNMKGDEIYKWLYLYYLGVNRIYSNN